MPRRLGPDGGRPRDTAARGAALARPHPLAVAGPGAAAAVAAALLPPELLRHAFSALDVRDLSRAARASSTWRDLAMPMLDAFEVAYVVARLVDRVGGPPAADSDVGDSDDGGWRDDDGHDDHDVNGECIGCGVGGAAGHQCLSCGAPVEPWDGSYHYDFGWVDGPRLA